MSWMLHRWVRKGLGRKYWVYLGRTKFRFGLLGFWYCGIKELKGMGSYMLYLEICRILMQRCKNLIWNLKMLCLKVKLDLLSKWNNQVINEYVYIQI